MPKRIASNLLKKNFHSTFLVCQKDQEKIWRKLFVESRPYSDKLKRLLVINTPDCLDSSQVQYQNVIDGYSVKRLKEEQYIKSVPKIEFGEHENVKAYIIMEFDDFTPSENPEYRNCVISFSIICQLDYWEMDDYNLRPWMIAGYIDGILDNSELTGIGKLQFMGASQLVLSEYLGGVLLRYMAVNSDNSDTEKAFEELPIPRQLGHLDT